MVLGSRKVGGEVGGVEGGETVDGIYCMTEDSIFN